MLNSLLRPAKDERGAVFADPMFANPMIEDSVIPLIPLEMYSVRLRRTLRSPELSFGRILSASAFQVTLPEIAAAFE
jgi:hypothetical protein